MGRYVSLRSWRLGAMNNPNRIGKISRKGAKVAKYKQNYKLEARNPKFETNSNGQESNFPNEPVSDFVIGI
jgi:hypothetical protein